MFRSGRNQQRTKSLLDTPTPSNIVGKVLLLGTGDSGKSTLFRHCVDSELVKDISDDIETGEVSRRKTDPAFNIATSLKELDVQSEYIRGCIFRTLLCGTTAVCEKVKFDPESGNLLENLKLIHGVVKDQEIDFFRYTLTEDVVEGLEILWKDENVRDVFNSWRYDAEMEEYQHLDFFLRQLQNYPSWGGDDWRPDLKDAVRIFTRTTGFARRFVHVKQIPVQIVDTGGQQNERKKWPSLFTVSGADYTDALSIVYVVSLSGYNQACFEDATKTRLADSLTLFKQLNQGLLKQPEGRIKSVAIVLNKLDVFKAKISRAPFSLSKDSEVIENNWEKSLSIIENEFLNISILKEKTRFYYSVATNPSDAKPIFKDSLQALVME